MHDYILVTFGIFLFFILNTFYTMFIVPVIQTRLMDGFLKSLDDEDDKMSFDDHVSTAPDMQA